MSESERRRAMDRELQRKGLILDEPEVLAAMEHAGPEGIRFLPVKVSSRTGAITGDAPVSAERLGRLERHIAAIIREIGRSWRPERSPPIPSGGDRSTTPASGATIPLPATLRRGGARTASATSPP